MGAQAVWVGRRHRPDSGRVVTLEDGQTIRLGRAPECEIVVEDRVVSAQHAELARTGEEIHARDLGSLNGTFVKLDGAEERRLDPEEVVSLSQAACLRVGPYLVTPCVRVSETVSIGDAPLLGVPTDPDLGADDELSPAPMDEGSARAILTLLDRFDAESAPDALLTSLLKLSGAKAGHLFACSGDRFMMLASKGHGGEICLSRSFLRATGNRDRTWAFRAGSEPEPDTPKSLLAFPEGTVLLGVPIRGRAAEPIAVAQLEAGEEAATPELRRELDHIARAGGALLQLALERDREARARRAAERALSDTRGHSAPAMEDGRAAPQLIGSAARFVEVVDRVRRAAPTASTLLIRGESGTGKEELARLAHAESRRSDGPFVALNGSSIPVELVESALFGHDAGAFTGASEDRPGAFERADGGTLFLDEIGDLPLSVQTSLLRVLESGEVVRVGGSVRNVDVRLVAATHRNLEQLVGSGAFRRDLYYRLRVIEVTLPRLADRPEDVLPLAEHFLGIYLTPEGNAVEGLSAAAAAALSRYGWPGNVRELRNVIERAVVLDEDGVLDIDDLPPEIVGDPPDAARGGLELLLNESWHDAKKRFEEIYFRRALERAGGAVQVAAGRSGVTRRLMTLKIKALNLRESDLPADPP